MKRKLYLASRDSNDPTGTIVMTADLETREVCTNYGDLYCDTIISIDQFLEFADFIRANIHADTKGRWENVGELFEQEKE